MKRSDEKKSEQAIISPELTARAKAGDQAAYTELYEKTYAALYRTICSMTRDEDTAWDILQESYLRAFQNLEKLDANEAFLPWLRRIAVNETARVMGRRMPVTFTDLSDEDGELPEIPDLRLEAQPELVMDQQETSRLVREIMADLPEQQRLIVGMHYYEDLSVKEIAALLRLATGTVKAQLHNGRKRVETRVRDLEKQGVKLYGLSPVAFLVALLRHMEPAEHVGRAALAQTLTKAGVSSAAAGVAAETGTTITAMTAGQALVHGLAAKVAVGVLSVTLIGGGIWAGSRALRQKGSETLGNYRPTEQVMEPYSVAQTDPIQLTTEPVETGPAVIVPAVTEPTVTEPTETEPEVTEPAQLGWPVDSETEAEIRALFDDPNSLYCHALTSEYADPIDLDLNKFFYDFYSSPSKGEGALTDQEREGLLELMDEEKDGWKLSLDCAKFDDYEARGALRELFDLTLQDYEAARTADVAELLGEGWYCLPWECYINFHSDSCMRAFEIQEVLQTDDGRVCVNYRYDDGDFAEMTLVLEYDDWRYRVLANQKRADALENPTRTGTSAELAKLERELSGDYYECLLVGDRRYFSNGKTRIWTYREKVLKMDLATGAVETLFSLDYDSEVEQKYDEKYGGLGIVTEDRLFFETGYNCYSVDYRNQNLKEYGYYVLMLDRGRWDGMGAYMEGGIETRHLTVIDRNENVIVDVPKRWSHALIDGSLYYISAVFEEGSYQSRCEVYRMDPDGSIIKIGTVDEAMEYYYYYFIDRDTREIVACSWSEGSERERRYDLFTLEPRE